MGRGQSSKTVNSTLRNTELNSVGDKPSLVKDGVKSWHKNGLLHRDNGQPAVINPNGELSWYIEGKLHRGDDKPALVKPYDREEWWEHGVKHRTNGPAVEYWNGTKEYWENGKLLRTVQNHMPTA